MFTRAKSIARDDRRQYVVERRPSGHSPRVFWLIAMLASVGAGAASVFITLQRMGGNFEGLFRAATDLAPAEFAEGAYGRITGVATAAKPLATPGGAPPSVLYELVVYKTYDDGHAVSTYRMVHRGLHGGEFDVRVGDTVVRVSSREIYVLTAPSLDSHEDLRDPSMRAVFDRHQSRVRFVPDGATVQIVGTLTREVDADPSAARDYRETATRYRLIAKKKQPLILACKARKQLAG
jgi:hypothetical protein